MTNGTTEATIPRAELERWALADLEREWTMARSRLSAALDVQMYIQETIGRDKRETIASLTAQLEECQIALRYIEQRRAKLVDQ